MLTSKLGSIPYMILIAPDLATVASLSSLISEASRIGDRFMYIVQLEFNQVDTMLPKLLKAVSHNLQKSCFSKLCSLTETQISLRGSTIFELYIFTRRRKISTSSPEDCLEYSVSMNVHIKPIDSRSRGIGRRLLVELTFESLQRTLSLEMEALRAGQMTSATHWIIMDMSQSTVSQEESAVVFWWKRPSNLFTENTFTRKGSN
ncbi:unnamed protein product [Protopolystoma xenopodis]|uniref:Uncharacterized protein n=1 Tax=Protopolystoma xenopodis TaxID=117903 RepID=A0A3S5B8K2_9PLAT|nr:unnamed protein product [Protopolystoma xenopodis]